MTDSRAGPIKTFVARQPIVTADHTLIGYELLFRGAADAEQARIRDGATATARVMEGALAQDLSSLTGGVPGFINFDRNLIEAGFPRLLQPPERFVIEVLESVSPDPEILDHILALTAEGFRFALDDVASVDRLRAFGPKFEFVKLDWTVLEPADFRAIVAEAGAIGAGVIVERIETEMDFADARALGCHYFQGFLLGRPATMERTIVPVIDTQLFQLLAALGDPAATPESMERMIVQDVALTYRILRFAASAHAAQRRARFTLREAIILLGRDACSATRWR